MSKVIGIGITVTPALLEFFKSLQLDKDFNNHKKDIGFYYESKSSVCIYDPKDVDYLIDMWDFTHDKDFIHNLAQGLMR